VAAHQQSVQQQGGPGVQQPQVQQHQHQHQQDQHQQPQQQQGQQQWPEEQQLRASSDSAFQALHMSSVGDHKTQVMEKSIPSIHSFIRSFFVVDISFN
jgi:hypothetical protein